MIVHRVLDEVMRSWSHVAVLRALLDTTSGFTGNEVARVAGMHPRSALKALSSLEELGIVRRQRGGRDHLFTLNRKHFLVTDALLALYASEQKFPVEIRAVLSTILKRRVICGVIFGSVAAKKETPQSDLDLCCIVREEHQKESVRDALESEAPVLYKSFGIKIAPLVLSRDEFRRRSKTPLIRGIIEHGQLVTGTHPRKLLNG